ncbi:MAG TPA: DUF484 family protein [Gammaproteobacteria bacterium]
MSQAKGSKQKACDADAVAGYLAEHPEFFSTRGELLASLQIPHPDNGRAISLIERQVQVLRDQHERGQHQLRHLVEVARDNDRLGERMHQLALCLLDCDSLAATTRCIHQHLASSFQADRVALLLFDDRASGPEVAGIAWRTAGAAALADFENILSGRTPICGRLTARQLAALFGDDLTAIASAVVIPLGDDTTFGVLAIGSTDPERYQHGMGTSFLQMLGQLVGRALQRHLQQLAAPQSGREAD